MVQDNRFIVYLRNDDTQAKTSFSDGQHGFTVRALDMDSALIATVERARAESIYGHDWTALVVPEQNAKWANDSVGVALCDAVDPARYACEVRTLPGGGVALY